MNIPSKHFEKAVDQLSTLPGVGRRSALRLALDLFKRSEVEIADFTSALIDFKQKVLHCNSCGNMTDDPICAICANPKRDHGTICIVEDIRDVMAIENTGYDGFYTKPLTKELFIKICSDLNLIKNRQWNILF